MKNRKSSFCFLVFTIICAIGLNGQVDFSINLSEYDSVKQSIYLLKNENGKIPLAGDDVRSINHESLFEASRPLTALMNLYFPVINSPLRFSESPKIKDEEKSTTILSINLSGEQLDAERVSSLEKKMMSDQTITLVFDPTQKIKSSGINFSKCAHLIYSSGISNLHQSLVVQILFGGIGIDNQLKEDLDINFQKGSGYTVEESIRLAYSPAALKGMDYKFLESNVSSIAQDAVDEGAFPGCQVLVVKDQHVVFHKAWGHHTYAQEQPVRLSDIYDFASVTKVTSALPALMRLHGEGKIDLDAPLKDVFPKFKKSNKADLTLRPILAHHAQLKPWIPYWRSTVKKNGKFKWRTFKKKSSRRFPIHITDQLFLHRKYKKRIYKAIRKSPLNDKSGYVYSGLVFYLWPEIVSSLTNEDYESYLKETFYEPLGASTITYNPDRFFPLDRIIPTENDTFFRKVQIHGKVHDEGAVMMGGVSANAGLFGSANDLAKLMQMYLNEGTYGGEQYIEAKSVREFTRCQYCEEDNRRGLGFDKPLIEYHPEKSSVARDASPSSYGHSGYTGTFTWVDPAENLIYIFFSNRVYPTRENRKIYTMNVRPRIHQVIYDALIK